MILFIGPPPANQQIARFGVAFSIILEHSFYLWDQTQSNSIQYLTSAIDVYKSSGKHVTVTKAIDTVFKEEERHLFEEANGSDDPGESAFVERLAQIALENRLSIP